MAALDLLFGQRPSNEMEPYMKWLFGPGMAGDGPVYGPQTGARWMDTARPQTAERETMDPWRKALFVLGSAATAAGGGNPNLPVWEELSQRRQRGKQEQLNREFAYKTRSAERSERAGERSEDIARAKRIRDEDLALRKQERTEDLDSKKQLMAVEQGNTIELQKMRADIEERMLGIKNELNKTGDMELYRNNLVESRDLVLSMVDLRKEVMSGREKGSAKELKAEMLIRARASFIGDPATKKAFLDNLELEWAEIMGPAFEKRKTASQERLAKEAEADILARQGDVGGLPVSPLRGQEGLPPADELSILFGRGGKYGLR